MIKRILVALSGTPFTTSAIRHGIELAQTHAAKLTGVTAFDTDRLSDVGPVPIGGGSAAQHLAEHRAELTADRINEVIAEFAQACTDAGVRHDVVKETGDALNELVSLWRYHDLTVFGLRGLFEYGVINNPDDLIIKLIGRGVRPILAVSEAFRPIKRVLVAFNGSTASAKAMKRFVQLRPFGDVELKIACFGFDDDDARSLLEPAAAYCTDHGIIPATESLPGYPEEGLRNHAEHWNADLVVMGAASRGTIAKLILGDTALDAMQHSSVPLFLSQ